MVAVSPMSAGLGPSGERVVDGTLSPERAGQEIRSETWSRHVPPKLCSSTFQRRRNEGSLASVRGGRHCHPARGPPATLPALESRSPHLAVRLSRRLLPLHPFLSTSAAAHALPLRPPGLAGELDTYLWGAPRWAIGKTLPRPNIGRQQ